MKTVILLLGWAAAGVGGPLDDEEDARTRRLAQQKSLLQEHREAPDVAADELQPVIRTRLAEHRREKWAKGSTGWFTVRSLKAYLEWNEPSDAGPVASQPDLEHHPHPVVVDFARQLTAHGIELLFLPIPNKLHVYPDEFHAGLRVEPGFAGHAPGTRPFLASLNEAGVEALDAFAPMARARAYDDAVDPLFLRSDPHWTPRGARLVAEQVGQHLLSLEGVERGPLIEGKDYVLKEFQRRFGSSEKSRAPEPESELLRLASVIQPDGRPFDARDRKSSIVVIGDSLVDNGRGFGGDFVSYLAVSTGHRIDSISVPGGGARECRNSLRIRFDNLEGKKVVVWMLSVNALRPSRSWIPLPMFK